jgi:sec-independent protein translocase protein TatB
MDILGVGSTELIIILVIAGIVLGPRRMARMALEFGKLVRNLRNYYVELTGDLSRELAMLAESEEQSQAQSETASPDPVSQVEGEKEPSDPAAVASPAFEPAANSETGSGGSSPGQD